MARARVFGPVGPAAVALAFATAGCVDGNVPPRPDVDVYAGPAKQLVTAPGCGSLELAVRDGRLFWTEKAKGSVKSMPAEGGAVTVLASNQHSPGAIAVDATAIYWISNAAKVIATRPHAGGGVKVLVEATQVAPIDGDENDINALLVDGGMLYFGRYTRVYKLPTSGGASTPLARSPDEDSGKPSAFAIDQTHLYQTEAFHQAVSRELLDGTQDGKLESGATAKLAPDRLAVSQGSLLLSSIAVWAGNVIWANGSTILQKALEDFEHAPTLSVTQKADGGVAPASDAGVSASGDVTGFVLSGDDLYFGEEDGDTIRKVVLSTGQETVLATGTSTPRQFVADAGAIYWSTDDCKIMRLPK